MKKILFPTDFSSASDHAFIYALKMAKQLGASITTLHCYELPTIKSNHLPRTTRMAFESITLEEFENYRDHVPHLREVAKKAGLDDIPIRHALQEGEALFNIVRIAKKENIDLIVMGTTGASGLKKVFLGSVASEVMEKAPCPVLAIPKDAVFEGEINQVAFATEYKKEEKNALNWLLDWSALKGSDIYCVHVDLSHTEALVRRMDAFQKEFDKRTNLHFEVIDETHFEKAIANYLTEKNIKVLAMVIHQRNFFKELFNYSLTKELAYHLTTPILAIPAKIIETLANPQSEEKEELAAA